MHRLPVGSRVAWKNIEGPSNYDGMARKKQASCIWKDDQTAKRKKERRRQREGDV